ncbi:MAG: tetratricopeptide repeat protein [Chthoniobacterales bacterium]|nr:tetratricopeptide repeat protein [Chthoniobacterales bacterium]
MLVVMARTLPSDDVAAGRGEKASSLEVSGDAASARGDRKEALSCWSEALEIFTDQAARDSAARVALKLAMTEETLGESASACTHYRQAADSYAQAGEARRVPMCLNNLAMLRKISGDLEEAASLLEEALELAANCHGQLHAETALIASNLGAVLCERGDLLGAEQRHMQALGIREQLFGPTHPDVGLTLGHLAVIHQVRGDDERARSFYSSALAILDEFPGLHEAERAVLRENLEEL